MIQDQPPAVVHTLDVVSSSTIILAWVTAFVGFLPVAAAVAVSIAGVVYYALAIYSHPAVRDWYHNRCARKVLKQKIALLRAQLALSKHDALDREFWHKIANETQITLGEIREHIDESVYKRGTKSKPRQTPASQDDDA